MEVRRYRNRFKFLTDSPGYTSHSGHPWLPDSRRSSSTGHTGLLSPLASAHLNEANRRMTHRETFIRKKYSCVGGMMFVSNANFGKSLNIWCVSEGLWFFSHRRPLIKETEPTYLRGERSWDKGSCCHWGQRSWGGGPPHWLAAWVSTGWPRSCSSRRWAVN